MQFSQVKHQNVPTHYFSSGYCFKHNFLDFMHPNNDLLREAAKKTLKEKNNFFLM